MVNLVAETVNEKHNYLLILSKAEVLSYLVLWMSDKVHIVIQRLVKTNKLIVLMSIMLEKRSRVYSFMLSKNYLSAQ